MRRWPPGCGPEAITGDCDAHVAQTPDRVRSGRSRRRGRHSRNSGLDTPDAPRPDPRSSAETAEAGQRRPRSGREPTWAGKRRPTRYRVPWPRRGPLSALAPWSAASSPALSRAPPCHRAQSGTKHERRWRPRGAHMGPLPYTRRRPSAFTLATASTEVSPGQWRLRAVNSPPLPSVVGLMSADAQAESPDQLRTRAIRARRMAVTARSPEAQSELVAYARQLEAEAEMAERAAHS
jgi:hypothetical protein